MLLNLFIALALATPVESSATDAADSDAGATETEATAEPEATEQPEEPAFELPEDPLGTAKSLHMAWDNRGAQTILEAYLASPTGYRQRTATRLLLGRVHTEQGQWDQASAQFYRVRLGEGGDAKVAAWYEILADLQRARPHAAIRECEEYIERFGLGRRASECMVVIGDAEASRARLQSARTAYAAYLDAPEHSTHMRDEEMALRLALATAKHRPERAISPLISLALNHRFAATGSAATAALQQLHRAGHETAVVPSDPKSRMALATSTRRSGWTDRAWSMFQTLQSEQSSNPEVAAWVERNAQRFQVSTRHPLPRIKAHIQRYENGEASGAIAWAIFEDWKKAGQWDQAARWGTIGLERHSKHWPWRHRKDDVAHAIMLSGDFKSASTAWASAAAAKHGPVAQSRFYCGLTAMLAGDLTTAHSELTAVVDRGGPLEMAARYWRIRTAERNGQTDTIADRTRIAEADEIGWYRLLLNDEQPEGPGWLSRDGTWQGPPVPRLTQPEPEEPSNTLVAGTAPIEIDTSYGLWRLPVPEPFSSPISADPPSEAPEPTEELAAQSDATPLPSGAAPSQYFNPTKAMNRLRRMGEAHQKIWPDLLDAYHLVQAGLTDESGPIVQAAFAEYRNPDSVRDPIRRAEIEALSIPKGHWMAISMVAGDYYFQAKHLWKRTDNNDAEVLGRLQFPIAYGRELWPHCQLWNLDPFLVLSIMRQESIYNAEALSPTGAIGLMQIIKGTGAKISSMLNEPFFSPVTLYNPSVNLRYSVYYLQLLNSRFGGNFPMAVASYNGGPHYMSSAHGQTMDALNLDAFVEMIPRSEPRNYVKKVVGFYQRYVELYGPPGATVVLPKKVEVDNPAVVNF